MFTGSRFLAIITLLGSENSPQQTRTQRSGRRQSSAPGGRFVPLLLILLAVFMVTFIIFAVAVITGLIQY